MPMWYTKLIYLVLLIIGLFFSVLYEGIFSMLLLGDFDFIAAHAAVARASCPKAAFYLALSGTDRDGTGNVTKIILHPAKQKPFSIELLSCDTGFTAGCNERNRAVRIAAALAGKFCCNGFLSVRSDALRKTADFCEKVSHCRLFSPVQLFCAKMHGSGGDCCSIRAGRKFVYAVFAAVRDGGQCQLRPEPPRR